MKNDPIVITGVGVLSPNGTDRESYFAATAEDARDPHHHAVRCRLTPCRIAAEVDFDPTQWVDPKNIRHVSRVVPMAIAAADEALRDASLDPLAMDLDGRRSIGVMLGSGGGAVEFSERMYELWYKGATKQASIYSIPSGTIGTIASEISMAYDLRGFSHLISTGCTSSTDAIGYAYRNLKLGVCDYVLAGGADATITEAVMTGLHHAHRHELVERPARGRLRPFTQPTASSSASSWMFVERVHRASAARHLRRGGGTRSRVTRTIAADG
jgi:3-oxoacyl-[acyl-carrier-protein] synthase II